MANRIIISTGAFNSKANSSIRFIRDDYRKFVDYTKRDMKRIMQGAAEIILKHTLPWVPYQYGGLRESARAFAGKTASGNYAAYVTFGGEDSPVEPTPNAPQGVVDYATLVHETQVAYLDIGGNEAEPEVTAYIISELKKTTPKRG